MEDSADIELYNKIVGNPAYSSSSDTSKSDPVSFQFKEPRLTERREEDFFARARSQPDPRIISHPLAGQNCQEPRSCDTFVECGSSRREFYDNSTILAPTSNTSIFNTYATVAPDVEPTHGISVRDKSAILAPNVGPTSNISILDKFATYNSSSVVNNSSLGTKRQCLAVAAPDFLRVGAKGGPRHF